MPQYEFLNEKTGETKDIFFHMNDEKKYIDESGYEWIRQMSIPNASIDTKLPENSRQFADKTKNKRGNIGDIWDYSKECGEKRKKEHGEFDPVKEQSYKDYSKTRKGKMHPEQRKEKLEKLQNTKVTLKLKK